jgi:hypothetical protein
VPNNRYSNSLEEYFILQGNCGLKVKPEEGDEFQTAGQLMVSRIAVPRVSDKIKIKYNKENPTQFIIV